MSKNLPFCVLAKTAELIKLVVPQPNCSFTLYYLGGLSRHNS